MMEGLVASKMDDLEGSRIEDLEVVSCRLDLDVSYRLDLAQQIILFDDYGLNNWFVALSIDMA